MLIVARTYIELWMHLGSLESLKEARVTFGYRFEQLLLFFRAIWLSKLPICIHNSTYAQ